MSRTVFRILIPVALLVVVLGAVLAVLSLSRPPALPPLPNPNGYTDLVKAAHMCDSSEGPNATLEELRGIVARNADGLKLARVGLERQCRVTLDLSSTNAGVFPDMAALKGLARAFEVEGRVAELEHRPGDAARSYLDSIRAGHEAARGGVIISFLVGIAMEGLGQGRLEKLAPNLDARTCRELASALEALEARREPFEATLAQERAWVRRAHGIKGQLMVLLTFKSVWTTQQRCNARMQSGQLRTRQLMVNLAARACELEKGVRPRQISELVPTYLKAIPLDPVTGTNLNYQL